MALACPPIPPASGIACFKLSLLFIPNPALVPLPEKEPSPSSNMDRDIKSITSGFDSFFSLNLYEIEKKDFVHELNFRNRFQVVYSSMVHDNYGISMYIYAV